LNGIRVDEIRIIAKARDLLLDGTIGQEINEGTEITSWLREIQNLAEQCSPNTYYTGQPREEAFWRSILGDRTVESRPAPPIFREYYQAVQTILLDSPRLESNSYDTLADLNIKSSKFTAAAMSTIRGRRFSITRKGYIGWVPPFTQEGDLICIFAGIHSPFLVRPHYRGRGLKTAYLLVGACYLNGMMDGEMWGDEMQTDIFTFC
jgi:hypothetical protein